MTLRGFLLSHSVVNIGAADHCDIFTIWANEGIVHVQNMLSHVYFTQFCVFLQDFVKHLVLKTEPSSDLLHICSSATIFSNFCWRWEMSDSLEAPAKEIAAHLVEMGFWNLSFVFQEKTTVTRIQNILHFTENSIPKLQCLGVLGMEQSVTLNVTVDVNGAVNGC